MSGVEINIQTLEYLEREFLASGDKIEINIFNKHRVNLILHYTKKIAIINIFFKKKFITSVYLYVVNVGGEMTISFPIKKNYPSREYKHNDLEKLKIRTILKDYLKIK